jgi:hypothetical protein
MKSPILPEKLDKRKKPISLQIVPELCIAFGEEILLSAKKYKKREK